MAYELELPTEMNMVHMVFHVSILRKLMSYLNSILPFWDVSIAKNLSDEEVQVDTLHQQVIRLRNKEVVFVKVLWRNQEVESAMWEAKMDLMKQYTYLFHSTQG